MLLHRERSAGSSIWNRIDLTVDPPPDLAIEVEITQQFASRLGIYAALGVVEVWRFDGESLNVLTTGSDGAYQTVKDSLAFPFLPDARGRALPA